MTDVTKIGQTSACGSVAVSPITPEIRRPQKPHEREVLVLYLKRPKPKTVIRVAGQGRFGYSDLKEAASVRGGCGLRYGFNRLGPQPTPPRCELAS